MAVPVLFVAGQASIAAVRWAAPHAVRALPYVRHSASAALEFGKSAFRRVIGGGARAAPAAPGAGSAAGAAAGTGSAASSLAARTGEAVRNGTSSALQSAGRVAQAGAVGAGMSVGNAAMSVGKTALTGAALIYALNAVRNYVSDSFFGPEDTRQRLTAMGPQSPNAGEIASRTPEQQHGLIERRGVGSVFEVNRDGRRLVIPVPGSEQIASPVDRLRHAQEWWAAERQSGRIATDLQPGDRLNLMNGQGQDIYTRGTDGRFGFDRDANQLNVAREGIRVRGMSSDRAMAAFASPEAGQSLFGNVLGVEPERLDNSRAAVADINGMKGVMIPSPTDQRALGFVAVDSERMMAGRVETEGTGMRAHSRVLAVDVGSASTMVQNGRLHVGDEAQRAAARIGEFSMDGNPIEAMARQHSGGRVMSMLRVNPDDPSKTTFQAAFDGGRAGERLQVSAKEGEISMSRISADGRPYGEPAVLRDPSISFDGRGKLSMSGQANAAMGEQFRSFGLGVGSELARGGFAALVPDRGLSVQPDRSMDAGIGR